MKIGMSELSKVRFRGKEEPLDVLKFLKDEIKNHRIIIPNPMVQATLNESCNYRKLVMSLIDEAIENEG